jgi:hypothetical protein
VQSLLLKSVVSKHSSTHNRSKLGVDKTYSYKKQPFASPAATNAQLASLSIDGSSEARSWQVQRFTTQDLYVPCPAGSVLRENTRLLLTVVANRAMEARAAFIV